MHFDASKLSLVLHKLLYHLVAWLLTDHDTYTAMSNITSSNSNKCYMLIEQFHTLSYYMSVYDYNTVYDVSYFTVA